MTTATAPLATADRVYYTGDVCNSDGWFISAPSPIPGGNVQLTEEDGGEDRVITIRASHIGDVYAGHCSPRFVTESAYRAFRAAVQS